MKKLYEALSTIKDECNKHKTCANCPMGDDFADCKLIENMPRYWALKKPSNRIFMEVCNGEIKGDN